MLQHLKTMTGYVLSKLGAIPLPDVFGFGAMIAVFAS